MDWMGNEGFGGVVTCIRDRLPGDIPGKYLHKKKTNNSDRIKVAQFFNPVVAVNDLHAIIEATRDTDGNDVEKEVSKSCPRVHVSFQSTSLCNYSTVSALNICKTTAMIRSRGRGDRKRYWGLR
eukprot:7349117-Ditylum_brightwellii.AAC.1